MRKSYVKPYLEEVNMIGRDLVADKQCMSPGGGDTRYYDWPGDGWVVITMNNSCKGTSRIEWHDNPKIEGEASDATRAEAFNRVRSLNSEYSQQFASILEDSTVGWS